MQLLKELFLKRAALLSPARIWQQKAWDRFEAVGFPSFKVERFHYFRYLEAPSLDLSPIGLECEGGEFVLSWDQAWQRYGIFLQQRFSSWMQNEKDPFALLNGALYQGGLFCYVPSSVKHGKLTFKESMQGSHVPRVHFVVGQNANLKIDWSSQNVAGYYNGFLDILVEEGAHVTLYLSKKEADECFLSLRATLKKESSLSVVGLSCGARISRSSYQVELQGEGAKVYLEGLCELKSTDQHHVQVLVEHKAPSCYSKQLFKTVLFDQSVSSFEGKIYVDSEAQKTDAYQLNNNLLLSDQAFAQSKPGLEIFADDVKASHGATMTELDPESLFYLKARGITLHEAKHLLVEGFKKEILDRFCLKGG